MWGLQNCSPLFMQERDVLEKCMLPDKLKIPVIRNPHPIEVSVPGSKSITNRALLIAALAKGKSVIKGVLFSDDSRYFLQALLDLGFRVEADEESRTVEIEGCGGKIPKKEASVYVGSAGTAARFLTALLGLSDGRYRMDSSGQMKKRPMKELLTALMDLGAEVEFLEEAYHFPFVIGCPSWKKQEVTVDVDKSSQFLSALLISSVLSERDFEIRVAGNHGMAYVDMTVSMMNRFGVSVEQRKLTGVQTDSDGTGITASYRISKDADYTPLCYEVEPDLSAACYFYAMCPILRVPAKVKGVKWDCLQGDIRFLHVLERMGCSVVKDFPECSADFSSEDGLVLLPPDDKLRGGRFDLSAFSDQALTLAAIAPFAESDVVIEHVGHIRLQECDRIEAILHNLRAMGIACREENGTITVHPGQIQACEIETYEDHRVAMAFSIPGLTCDGIIIQNPACCRKTFENYFDVLEGLCTKQEKE